MAKPDTLPWWRRLSVRVTALVALTVLAFDASAPLLMKGICGLFGLRADGEFAIAYDNQDDDAMRWWIVSPSLQEAALALIENGVDSAARARFESELEAWRPEVQYAYFVADAQLLVCCSSDHRPLPPGQPLLLSKRDQAMRDIFAIRRDDVLRGWLCLVPPDPFGESDPVAELPEDIIMLTEEEANIEFERLELAGVGVQYLLLIGIALSAGLAVSWFVTRRVTRLAEAAHREDLPGPKLQEDANTDLRKVVGGSDEIAALAVRLTAARTRVRELVGELDTRDAERREWIAQVSHDLRTPLTALVASLERARPIAAQLPADAGSRSQQRVLLEAIDVATCDADRVSMLARDLLDAARLDMAKEHHPEPLLVGELIHQARRELSPLATKAGLTLLADCPSDLPEVEGDGHLLLRVLENLTRNAIEHADSSVRIEARSVASANGASRVRIAVVDDGPGLASAKAADKTRRSDSAGLGLRVARQILAAHDSTLELRGSAGGKGTTGQFELLARPFS
ncbi:MAG: sensor histidine kinase [Planctomycetota bacterium]